jgi:hypothetical protein
VTLFEALANVDGVEHIDARQGHDGDLAIAIRMTRHPSQMDVARLMSAMESVVPAVCRVACLVTQPKGSKPEVAPNGIAEAAQALLDRIAKEHG